MSDPSFSCMALLEDEICLLYEELVGKAENIEVELFLDLILQRKQGSQRAFSTFDKLFARYEPNPSIDACGKQMGKLFIEGLNATRSVRDRVHAGMPVMEAVQELLKIEENAGEEQLTEMHSEIRALEKNNSELKRILHDIAEDERNHVKILRQVPEITSK